ncbi:MAG: hypothetical protein OFPII_06230 [Osedax symbiont Rs1]|nr:MAG: hypothetical protein OFPII_06230 [Osedax symbiont Rs1]
MPHCILEYSAGVARQISKLSLLEAVFQGAQDSTLFADDDIKTRAICFDDYSCGANLQSVEGHEFVHVEIKILAGRNLEQRTTLSQQVLNRLSLLAISNLSMTVQITEIERQSYAKTIG